MLKQHARVVVLFRYITDIILTVLAFFIAYWIRAYPITEFGLSSLFPLKFYLWMLPLILIVWSYLLYYFRAYKSFRTSPLIDELKIVFMVVLVGGLVVGALVFIAHYHTISRTFVLTFALIDLALLSMGRILIRQLSRQIRKKGYNYRNVIIVGTGETALDVLGMIGSHGGWGLRLVGFVYSDGAPSQKVFRGHPVLGGIEDLEGIIKKRAVDEVVFAVSRGKYGEMEEVLLMLEDYGVTTKIMVDFFPHTRASMHLDDFFGMPFLTFSTVPTNLAALATKRVFDVVMASLLLSLAMPVMLLTSILIKVTSPGPAIFSQKRCGKNGRVFTMHKFRSMVADAEQRRGELDELNEMEGPAFKMKNDPRITRVGRFIRKTSIDELPQLWNVLVGDMSIVGPRPPLPDEVAHYERWQRRRLSMKPGLTCLWQVTGRNTVKDFDEWVRRDLEYIDRWSLALDLKIFFWTIPVVLFGKGAA